MPITNKDGTPYRLKGPNKLTIDQVVWGPEDKLVLHNCRWRVEQSTQPEEAVVPIKTPIKIKPMVIKPKEEPVIIQQEPAPVEAELANPVVAEEPKPKYRVNTQNIVIFHCQPVVLRETKDDLYGDKYKRVERGKKFTFEGIIVDNIDIAMTFWTNLQIPKDSVVYPARYRTGKKYNEFRWWKVVDSQPKANGVLYKTIPSDYTPDFSD